LGKTRHSVAVLALPLMVVAFGTLSLSSVEGESNEEAGELVSFLDGFMTAQLRAYRVPGAAVCVVRDGEVVLAAGYGYSEVEDGRPVSADGTLFRVASITKLFTWTAVMQLVEDGKLDPDADVNSYLEGFQIPSDFPGSITISHLATHTAGFDRARDMSAAEVGELRPLGEVLSDHLPGRVRPPGEFTAYSNYGAALAGLVVQEASGVPYESYVKENILDPLGMARTTLAQPPPPGLAENLATGYIYSRGAYRPGSFLYHQLVPAISMSSTATDMARFMIAHLQDGCYGNTSILEEDQARLMKDRLFTNDLSVSGWAFGFMEIFSNGRRIIMHGGSWGQFYSLLALVPEDDIGLFVAYNSPGGGPARSALLRAFLDHLYPPGPQQVLPVPGDPRPEIHRFGGSYRKTGSAYLTISKLSNLNAQIDLKVEGGTLVMSGFGDTQPWVISGPLTFSAVGRQPHFSGELVFREDGAGRITHFFLSNDARFAFERVPWYEGTGFTYTFLGACGLIFLSAVAWPLGYIRRPRRTWIVKEPAMPRLSRAIVGFVALSNLIFIFIMATLGLGTGHAYWVPSSTLALLTVVSASAILALISPAFLALSWRDGHWGALGRLHLSAVALASLAFVWWLINWHLIGFQF